MLNSNETQKIRVVGYCRGNEKSIDHQIRCIREYVGNSSSMELQCVFADYKRSGTDPNRVSYLQMMTAIKIHEVDMVVCTDTAKIYTDRNKLVEFFYMLQQSGVNCMFLNSPGKTVDDYLDDLDGGESYAENEI